jgi:hypothetical protein
MKKSFFFYLLTILLSLRLAAQEKPLQDTLPLADSSVLQNDSITIDEDMLADLRFLLDSLKIRKSFFSVDFGVGNRLFSVRNINFNAQQVTSNRISFTPSVTYYHKSGFGLNAVAFLSSFEGNLKFYQYAFSPSYDYLNNPKVSFGLSYTYYLTRDDLSVYATPFKHELYGYLRGRKGWLRPGFSMGWATGTYTDVKQLDTVIFGIPRRFVDTTLIGLQDFSMTFSAAHYIDFEDLFKKGDGLSISPIIMLVTGAQNYAADSKTTLFSGTRLRNVTRRYSSATTDKTGLRFQSLAAALSATYFIDKLSLSAGYFISYYLPETDKPFSHIFSINAGLTF